jgi:hypothetical protein
MMGDIIKYGIGTDHDTYRSILLLEAIKENYQAYKNKHNKTVVSSHNFKYNK